MSDVQITPINKISPTSGTNLSIVLRDLFATTDTLHGMIIKYAHLTPGFEAPGSAHEGQDELLILTNGIIEFQAGDGALVTLEAPTQVFIPAGTTHRYSLPNAQSFADLVAIFWGLD